MAEHASDIAPVADRTADLERSFVGAIAGVEPAPVLILAHNDADGLAAGVILVKALQRAGREGFVRIVGRGESPWSQEMRAELAPQRLGGLIVADPGLRAEIIRSDVPTIFIDHIRGDVATIAFSSVCQVHPLVAQAWVNRLRDRIVIAANFGFRPGWVHFAARSAMDVDLVAFLGSHAPAGADENYGSGHRKVTGGALRLADWNAFVRDLGFGPDLEAEI